jgi:hypothetical protein
VPEEEVPEEEMPEEEMPEVDAPPAPVDPPLETGTVLPQAGKVARARARRLNRMDP